MRGAAATLVLSAAGLPALPPKAEIETHAVLRQCITARAAASTATHLGGHGFSEIAASRGESAAQVRRRERTPRLSGGGPAASTCGSGLHTGAQ